MGKLSWLARRTVYHRQGPLDCSRKCSSKESTRSCWRKVCWRPRTQRTTCISSLRRDMLNTRSICRGGLLRSRKRKKTLRWRRNFICPSRQRSSRTGTTSMNWWWRPIRNQGIAFRLDFFLSMGTTRRWRCSMRRWSKITRGGSRRTSSATSSKGAGRRLVSLLIILLYE